MDGEVARRFFQIEALADAIVSRLAGEVVRLGFDPAEVTLKPPSAAHYRLERDPSSGEQGLVGEWLDANGMKLGSLLFHADGSFFVEQDIVRPHPVKKRWFVEAVNAWGRDGDIKAEARLLPMPQ